MRPGFAPAILRSRFLQPFPRIRKNHRQNSEGDFFSLAQNSIADILNFLARRNAARSDRQKKHRAAQRRVELGTPAAHQLLKLAKLDKKCVVRTTLFLRHAPHLRLKRLQTAAQLRRQNLQNLAVENRGGKLCIAAHAVRHVDGSFSKAHFEKTRNENFEFATISLYNWDYCFSLQKLSRIA